MNLDDFEKEFEQEHVRRIARLVGGENINLGGDPRSGDVNRIMLRAAETLARDIRSFRKRHAQVAYRGQYYRITAAMEKQIAAALKAMSLNLTKTIEDAMAGAWQLNNEKWDAIAARYEKGVRVPSSVRASMHQLNISAMNAFIERKVRDMNLSKHVWSLVEPNKTLLEQYVGSGITIGRSAQKISLDVRNILKEPERLFRRVRDEDGELVLSKAARAYHPGPGVYRSSYKNAMRLAVTETNMAYRLADVERRKQLPFVLGIRVNLSKAHPKLDICDSMAGEYPPSFIFSGWHPWCLCYTTTVLMDKEEFVQFIQTGDIDGRQYVRSIPDSAKRFVERNLPSIQKMENRPYWFGDNFTKKGTLRQSIAKEYVT